MRETVLPSLKIGRFFGINVFVHWTFWLLPMWVVLSQHFRPEEASPSLGMHLGLLFAVFGCVVMHEYGHALAARFFGISTHDITLYPIGGVARLERMSERPWEEFFIAIAGPLVNVAIVLPLAIALFAGVLLMPQFLETSIGTFLFLLAVTNVLLVVFNMIPAFPMDGGRVLRSLLATRMGQLRATRVAVKVGSAISVVAIVLVLTALWFKVSLSPMLLLIGFFVLWAGQQELAALEHRERRRLRGEEEPIVVDLLDEPPVWRPQPATVTVYVWDAGRSEWIKQGTVSQPPRYRQGRGYGAI